METLTQIMNRLKLEPSFEELIHGPSFNNDGYTYVCIIQSNKFVTFSDKSFTKGFDKCYIVRGK